MCLLGEWEHQNAYINGKNILNVIILGKITYKMRENADNFQENFF